MAEVSVPGRSSPPSYAENDEVFDFVCSVCKRDKYKVEARAFCIECEDYLCAACFNVHSRTKSTKKHQILDGIDIDKAEQLCPKHKGQFVDFFCCSHRDVLCLKCKDSFHSRCSDVTFVDEVCGGYHGSKQIQSFTETLETLIKRLTLFRTGMTGGIRKLEQQQKSLLGEVRSLRNRLNRLLDKLEDKMEQRITEAIQKQSREMAEQLSKLGDTINSLDDDAARLRDVISSGGERKIFIQVHKLDIAKMKTLYQDLQREHRQVSLKFEPDGKIVELLGNLKKMGEMIVETRESATDDVIPQLLGNMEQLREPIAPSLKDMKIVKRGRHSVNERFQSGTPKITGATFLPDDTLLLCDQR